MGGISPTTVIEARTAGQSLPFSCTCEHESHCETTLNQFAVVDVMMHLLVQLGKIGADAKKRNEQVFYRNVATESMSHSLKKTDQLKWRRK